MLSMMMAMALANTIDPQQQAPAPQPATSVSSPVTEGSPATARKPINYCIKDTVTGSRLERKVCKTRDEWLEQGFDPLDAKR